MRIPGLILVGHMVLLLVLSTISDPGNPGKVGSLLLLVPPTVQNVLHIPAYGLLALLWVRTLKAYGVADRKSSWIAFLLASGYGAVTELVQAWVPGRFPSILDFTLDIAGILLFIRLYCRVRAQHYLSS